MKKNSLSLLLNSNLIIENRNMSGNVENAKIPILFLIFNRKDVATQAIRSIREYAPIRLYIAADGPRDTKVGEFEKCEETRQAVLGMIDWPCDVRTLFRNKNLGCAKAVSGAIDWFFDNEEFGIIIEDDIILSQDFYRFAKEMDIRYRSDERVMCINAQYFGQKDVFDTSYTFSTMGNCWGWATWRRAWSKMDLSMSLFPMTTFMKHMRSFGLFRAIMLYFYYWRHDYRLISSGGDISSWATRWNFSIFANDGLAIVPTRNLTINVGMKEGVHYTASDDDLYSHLKLESLPPQIIHPAKVEADCRIRNIENADFLRIRLKGLLKKIKKHQIHR